MSHTNTDLLALVSSLRSRDPSTLTKEELLQWATVVEQAASVTPPTLVEVGKGGNARLPELSKARDGGKVEERQRKQLTSSTSPVKLQNLSICITSVLEAIMEETRCDAVSLCVSHRGLEDEFRCLCHLSQHSSRLVMGSGLVRGTNTLEYACHRSGYFLHTGPKAVLTADNGVGTDCVTFLEMMDKPNSKGPPLSRKLFRICCPVRTTHSTHPIGVVTVNYKGSKALSADMENFIFDASCILGNLLRKCDDYAALQTCFSKGGQRESLPPCPPLAAVDIPERMEQLVYRVQVNPDDPGDSIRVSTEGGATKKLREGSPITSIFHHMRTLQDSWGSAVRLNVELRKICDEKEEQIFALLSQNRQLKGNSTEKSSPHTTT